VTETGLVLLDESILSAEPWLPRTLRPYIEQEIHSLDSDIARCLRRYRNGRQPRDFLGKNVILVDDGALSGVTLVAALQSLRQLGVTRLVGGLPIASEESIAQIDALTDELVVLLSPKTLQTLENYYDDCGELSDEVECAPQTGEFRSQVEYGPISGFHV
jgi:predicted phosphoribosyltransferase